MPLTDLKIQKLKATEKKQKHPCGNSLFLFVERRAQSKCCKRFVGLMRYQGNPIEIGIGVYGKNHGQWSLAKAKDEWVRLRNYHSITGKDPRDLLKEERNKKSIKQVGGITLQELVDEFLIWREKVDKKAASTILDEKRKLIKDVVPELGKSTPVKHLGWSRKYQGRTGREAILSITDAIEGRGSHNQAKKVAGVLKNLFKFAIYRDYMEKDDNPAVATEFVGAQHEEGTNPCLSWDELPELLDDLNKNRGNGTPIVIAALKMDILTFVRVGSLVPMKWDELDYEEDLWRIPASRMKNRKPHLVPLTDPIKELLEQLRNISGSRDYVFWSPRGIKTPHINESALNQHLKVRLNYKDRQTAHGLRKLPATVGQEVLKFPYEIISRQLSHQQGNKVRQAYDQSQMLEERWEFMNAWCDALIKHGMEI